MPTGALGLVDHLATMSLRGLNQLWRDHLRRRDPFGELGVLLLGPKGEAQGVAPSNRFCGFGCPPRFAQYASPAPWDIEFGSRENHVGKNSEKSFGGGGSIYLVPNKPSYPFNFRRV
eukprot:351782-Amphidinium_carterae.1